MNGFDLDPASGAEEEPVAGTVYTKEDDGLHQQWFGRVFVNPPFSDKVEWLEKAMREMNNGNAELILMVLPVDTSTEWFHKYVTEAEIVCFLGPGRIKFLGSDRNDSTCPNFAVMIVVFGEIDQTELLQVLQDRGVVYWNNAMYRKSRQMMLTEADSQ